MTIISDTLRNAFDIINDVTGNTITFKGTQVMGSFRHESIIINDIQTRSPVFRCMESDIPGVAIRNLNESPTANDTLVVDGIAYSITSIQPDGYGSLMLVLSRD